LWGSERLNSLLERIAKAPKVKEIIGNIEADPEYQVLVDANAVTVDISLEIAKIHRFVKDYYNKQWPELESTVFNPSEYAKVVLKIRTNTDINNVDLSSILSPQAIMVIRLTPTGNRTAIS
jgi:U4/U6 small nuclear ribonucleoprotein PRP31